VVVIGVVAVIAQQEHVFFIRTATNDAAPPCFVLFVFGWDLVIVSHCLNFVGYRIGA